jgi:ubiquinone biosynthesis protein Coq4
MQPAPLPPRRLSWRTRVRRLWLARRDPARIGDAAVLQSALMGVKMSATARAGVDRLLVQRGPGALRPVLDEVALRGLPPGTFGRSLIDFCDTHSIVRATVSDEIDDAELVEMGAVVRYILIHDMLHVRLGSDTSIPEELRITAFILQRGRILARCARLLLAEPLEDFFAEDFSTVQERLGLPQVPAPVLP